MTPDAASRPRRRRALLVVLASALVVALGVAITAPDSSEPPALLWVLDGPDDPPDVRRDPGGRVERGKWLRLSSVTLACADGATHRASETIFVRETSPGLTSRLRSWLGLEAARRPLNLGSCDYETTKMYETRADGRCWQAIVRRWPFAPEEGEPRAELAGRWEIVAEGSTAAEVVNLRPDGTVGGAATWFASWRAAGRVVRLDGSLAVLRPAPPAAVVVLDATGERFAGRRLIGWGIGSGDLEGRRVRE